MKGLLLPISLFISHIVLCQIDTLPIAEVNETYNNSITTAMDSSAIEYDLAGIEKARTKFVWDGVGFVPNTKTEISYLPNATVKTAITQWDGNAWEPFQELYRQFNGAGTQIATLMLGWNVNQFDTLSRSITTFGTNTDTTIQENWVSAGNWEPTTMDVRELNANNEVTLFAQFTYNGSSFVPYYQDIRRYGAGGELDTSYYVSGTTDTLSRAIYSYSNGLLILTLQYQKLPGTGWEQLFRSELVYNSQQLLIRQINQIWTGTEWVNENRYETAYNTAGNKLVLDYYAWGSTLSLWGKTRQTRYHYPQSTGLISSPIKSALKTWPNPFGVDLQIQLPNAQSDIEVTLFNLAGQQVMHHTFSSDKATFDTSLLPAGSYLVVVTDGTQYYRQHLVKVH